MEGGRGGSREVQTGSGVGRRTPRQEGRRPGTQHGKSPGVKYLACHVVITTSVLFNTRFLLSSYTPGNT